MHDTSICNTRISSPLNLFSLITVKLKDILSIKIFLSLGGNKVVFPPITISAIKSPPGGLLDFTKDKTSVKKAFKKGY